MVATLLTELARLGITLIAIDGQLRYYPPAAMTLGLIDRLREHKDELLEVLSNPRLMPEVRQEFELIDWDDCAKPSACPECGGLTAWWNPLREKFCMQCNPPTVARRAIEHVKRIRRTCGISTLTASNYQSVPGRRPRSECTRDESNEPILTT